MKFARTYSAPGDPYAGIAFEPRTSRIANPDGRVVFEAADIAIPAGWSQVATDIIAQKYFRKAGVPSKTVPVAEEGVPEWLWRSEPADDAVFGGESDARQVFHRLAGCWTYWGFKHGYFDSEFEARAYYDEMCAMLARQVAAPNSPQWFNTGLHWAYGIAGPAQGHSYVDPKTGELSQSTSAYERPSPHACLPYHATVTTPDGPVAIGAIVENNLVGLPVYDERGTTRVVATAYNGVKPVYRVRLANGNAIEATADHLVLACDGHKTERIWREVRTLTPGMRLVQRTDTSIESVGDRMQVVEAALAGWLQADGFVGQYQRGTNRSLTVEALTIDDAEREYVGTLVATVFGDAHSHERRVESKNASLDVRRLRLYGEDLRPFVERYGLLDRRLEMQVPPIVESSGANVVVAYLRALFQADGCVRIREERASSDVVFGTISPKLATGVSKLLHNLGIYNRVQVGHDSREDRQPYYHVVIAWANAKRKFADQIGFVSPEKRGKLENALAMPGRNVSRVRDEVITAIEYVGDIDVYDIETESHAFLTNNIVVHNCFIQGVEDDLVNEGGIMDLWVREARIYKFGSGSGSNFSKIRGAGEKLSGGGTSSGLMSFLKVGDRAAGAIKSGGTTRRAAKMVCLDLDHPDIEEFIGWKVSEEQKVSDLVTGSIVCEKHLNAVMNAATDESLPESARLDPTLNVGLKKAIRTALGMGIPQANVQYALDFAKQGYKELAIETYDTNWDSKAYFTVSGQNSNNSVRVPNEFFARLDAGQTWDLVPRAMKYGHGSAAKIKTVPAADLWEKIAVAAWQCADPGVQYDTTINEWHTCPADGPINASNPCVTGDTLVATADGLRRIDSLVGTAAFVVGADGKPHFVNRIFPTGTKSVYTLRTRSGFQLRVTADHKIFTEERGDVAVKDLIIGERLMLGSSGFGSRMLDASLAESIGLMIGDGSASRHERTQSVPMTITTQDAVQRRTTQHATRVAARVATTTSTVVELFHEFVTVDAMTGARRFSSAVHELDRASTAAMLRGVFTADGAVMNSGQHTQYVALDSTSTELLGQVQLLLLSFGVKAKIHRARGSESQTHSLRILRSAQHAFAREIGFHAASAKAPALHDIGAPAPSRCAYLADELAFVRYDGVENVYDLTEPDTSHFVANGVVVHNCSEYMFLDDTACFAPETRISTPNGLRTVEDLYLEQQSGRRVTITTDLHGEHDHRRMTSHRPAYVTKVGVRDVYRMTLKDGREIRATEDHRFLTKGGEWKRLDELKPGHDRVAIRESGNPVAFTSPEPDVKRWQMLGWLSGDGVFSKDTVALVFGPNERDTAIAMTEQLNELKAAAAGDAPVRPSNVGVHRSGVMQVTTSQTSLVQYLENRYGYRQGTAIAKDVPSTIHAVADDLKVAYLQGLFSADGCIMDNKSGTEPQVMLASSSREMLRSVQLLLSDIGITSRITWSHPEGRSNPQGQLHVFNQQARTFLNVVGFPCSSAKQQRAEALLGGPFRDALKQPRAPKVVSIEPAGTTVVYDVTEPVTRSVIVEGMIAHNCNLASLNLVKFTDEAGHFDARRFAEACRIWTFTLEVSVLMAQFPSKQVAQRSFDYRTLGLGYANLGTMLMRMGLPYDSEEGFGWCAAISSLTTGAAYKASAEMARELGPFPRYDANSEHMGRVLRNHRAAAYAVPDEQYEELTVKPTTHAPTLFTQETWALARSVWDNALAIGEVAGYRNAQVTCIAPTGCLVGDSLVATDRGLMRLNRLGDVDGEKWQDVEFRVLTDDGEQRATKFFVNGVEPTRRITTASGYVIQGTPTHRIKVVDPKTGDLQWKRFAEVTSSDVVALSLGALAGAPRTVKLPPFGEEYWTADYTTRVPRTMTPQLAELIGYFMGDGSLHAEGLRFCVAAADKDVLAHLTSSIRGLFGIESKITPKGGYVEIAAHSVALTEWWEACGFAKLPPSADHRGKGYVARVPDAVLASNDAAVYGAFVRGVFEADGTVTNGAACWSTVTKSFSDDVKTLMLHLGIPTRTKVDMSGWGQSELYVVPVRNASYATAFVEKIGFIGARKHEAVSVRESWQGTKGDRVFLPGRARTHAGADRERSVRAHAAIPPPERRCGEPRDGDGAARPHAEPEDCVGARVLLRRRRLERGRRRAADLRPLGAGERHVHRERLRVAQHDRALDGL